MPGSFAAVDSGCRSAVTIGAYDGVHVGHRLVIEHVRSLAAGEGLRSVVVTFDRHPAAVVRPESAPRLLTDLLQKLELLASTGIDEIEVVHFDEERASETAEDFVTSVLVGQLRVASVVVGRNFHFGKGRGGNVSLLEEMGSDLGFRVVPFDLVMDEVAGDDPEPVSSTRIRRLIGEGDLAGAEQLLARPHEVRGVVSEASPSGTAEVTVPDEILLPPAGRYAVKAGVLACRDEWHEGEAIVGTGAVAGGNLVRVRADGFAAVTGDAVRVAFSRPV